MPSHKRPPRHVVKPLDGILSVKISYHGRLFRLCVRLRLVKVRVKVSVIAIAGFIASLVTMLIYGHR